jgi:hydroxyacylglutathione hydrolase
MLEIVTLVLGPVETNTYLIADTTVGCAVVVDPAWDGQVIIDEAVKKRWKIEALWLTHAHFDHLGGAAGIVSGSLYPIVVALHPDDLPLWEVKGGAPWFGFQIELPPRPTLLLKHQQHLYVGRYEFITYHTPGHTQGHVIFECPAEGILFCGDLIFRGGIGRTDLPGGDLNTLLASIRDQVLVLPASTRLLSGHGQETTVGNERDSNPFL